jgi:DNA-binding response OmpR family regulator
VFGQSSFAAFWRSHPLSGGESMAGERILVIDDSVTHRELMVLTLETLDYWVDTAEDGKEGLHKVIESHPDLILLDLTMGGMDGFEVCRRLKSRPETRFIPVILLTTSQSTMDRTKGLEAGADDYLLKGIDGRELDARIQWVLARYRKGFAGDPLTRLPGAPAAVEEIRDRLQKGVKFGVVFIGIKDFEAFSRHYGVARGNDVLTRASNVIREVLMENSSPEDYAASLGGDNFVVLSSPHKSVGLAEEFVEHINLILPEAYNQEDRDRGYLVAKDRRGDSHQHEMMVAIAAIVSNENRNFDHPEEVFAVGRELFNYIKILKGKRVMKDRRRN